MEYKIKIILPCLRASINSVSLYFFFFRFSVKVGSNHADDGVYADDQEMSVHYVSIY